MRSTHLTVFSVGCGLALLLGSGCGKDSATVSQSDSKAFDSASPEAKALWEKALAADAATNYVDAMKDLKALRAMQLSDAQATLLDKESTDFNQRMFAAAEKNEPSAVQAVQILRTRP